jgi:hypothetical protein
MEIFAQFFLWLTALRILEKAGWLYKDQWPVTKRFNANMVLLQLLVNGALLIWGIIVLW